MMRYSLIIVWISFLFNPVAHATILEGLYEVKLPATTQSRDERQQIIQQAFQILLVRMTGDEQIATRPELAEKIALGSQFVRLFRYETVPTTLLDASRLEPGQRNAAPQEKHLLAVTFDENAVNKLLWEKKLPFWGKTRPSALVWIVVQDQDSRYLMDANVPSEILDAVREAGVLRGIPLLFPLLDLQDQTAINVTDVWGNFEATIRNASARYEAEAVLVGRLVRDPFGGWTARWSIFKETESVVWEARSALLENVVESGIGHLAGDFAQRFAHAATGDQELPRLIQVLQVKNLKDYVRASKYIESLASVAKLHPATIEANRVTFSMELRGSVENLQKAISLGNILYLNKPGANVENGTEQVLSYSLRP